MTSANSSVRLPRVPAALRARLRAKGVCSRTSIGFTVVNRLSESCMRNKPRN